MNINFGTNVTRCSVIFDVNGNYGISNNMWVHGNNWNGQAAFPNGVARVSCNISPVLNRRIDIPNSVTNCAYMFSGCFRLNQNIQIPNNVTNASGMFSNCRNLNQNIQIPNSVTNVINIFMGCSNLNQNIQIPNNVTNCYRMFQRCINLNQNIQIPTTVTTIAGMFQGCLNLNQNIQIPNTVAKTNYMFQGCSNLNQNIQIPTSVTNIVGMFMDCDNLSNITVLSQNRVDTNTHSFVRSNATKSINIWTDSETAINIMNAGFIDWNIKPTMEPITNGYYNAQYNVYIYTNAFS